MNAIAPTQPAVRRPFRISLKADPAAVAEARNLVREAVYAWNVPVDPSIAALLTSELVTNAIRYETGGSIKVFVACSCGHLRVYVHDTSRSAPVPGEAQADAEAGRGLMLVGSLSTDWGYFRTPQGKAVYFTLAFRFDGADKLDRDRQGDRSCVR